MTSIRPGNRLLTMGPWMVVLLGMICGACQRNSPGQGGGTPPKDQALAAPPSCKQPTTPAELRACVRDLEFDTLELAGDEQRLMVCSAGKCSYGPLARIEPEKRSYEGDLSKGRIIARLLLDPGEKAGYSKLGLAPGDTTYWWVQKIPGRPDSKAGPSVYFTISGDTLVKKEFTLQFQAYRDAAPTQALARWLWVEDDEKTEGGCPSGTCK
jgi:hypothetical protein